MEAPVSLSERGGRPAGRWMPSAAAVVAALVVWGCGVAVERPADDTAAAGGPPRCFVTERSVLAREPGGPAHGPAGLHGWIRLDAPAAADGGGVLLVDSDGAALGGRWRRLPGDSVHVVAFDDFLRVEMRLAVREGEATGPASAYSDAALERDGAGALRDVRRAWPVAARLAPCDSLSAARAPGAAR